MFLHFAPLLLLHAPSPSKGECCNNLVISLSGKAADQHGEISGKYTRDRDMGDRESTYSQMTGSRTWKIGFNVKWKVYKEEDTRPRLRERIATECPVNVEWEYYCYKHCGTKPWRNDSSILVNCEKEDVTKSKENLIFFIIGGVVMVLPLIAIAAFLMHKYCKSRKENHEDDNQMDTNPVYMDDYADPDSNNEIYDRNACYGVDDMGEESTVVTDLNPEYETCL